jgi:hypothetical protein
MFNHFTVRTYTKKKYTFSYNLPINQLSTSLDAQLVWHTKLKTSRFLTISSKSGDVYVVVLHKIYKLHTEQEVPSL